MEPKKGLGNIAVPLAIIIAGALIAGALFFRGGATPRTIPPEGLPNIDAISVKAVSADDHILGNPNADIIVIEYSDTECPYCKTFHGTMHQVMDEYGPQGKVAWVYRHFPLYKGNNPLHPRAGKQAEATECAAELGGNSKFWEFTDRIYEITPANNGFDMALLPVIAEEIGLDKTAFQTCLDSGKYANKISRSYDEALEAGANGTPYSILISRDGMQVPVTGARSYSVLKSVIDTMLEGDRPGGVVIE